MWAKEFTYPTLAKSFQLILGFHSLGPSEPAGAPPPPHLGTFLHLLATFCVSVALFYISTKGVSHCGLAFYIKKYLEGKRRIMEIQIFSPCKNITFTKQILYKKPKSFKIS
jgi:hypothetical protein